MPIHSSDRGPGRLSLNELRAVAGGRWPKLLVALGLPAESLTTKNKACPACGGHDRFSFNDKHGSGSFVCRAHDRQGGDGFELLMHFLGCDLRGALAAVAEAIGGKVGPLPRLAPPAAVVPPGRDDGEALRRLWQAAGPVTESDPVGRYLVRRGIFPGHVSPVLRCHLALPYWLTGGAHPVRLGSFPAMLAAVQGENGVTVAIHRTYLATDGEKADFRDPASGDALPVRKLKTRSEGVMPGAAIRLFDPVDGRLFVAEGIETALAVNLVAGVPAWACVSANGLASVVLPPAVKQVFVAADNDHNSAGQRAAKALADRLKQEGRRVEVLFPTTPGFDWLDVLNAERSQA